MDHLASRRDAERAEKQRAGWSARLREVVACVLRRMGGGLMLAVRAHRQEPMPLGFAWFLCTSSDCVRLGSCQMPNSERDLRCLIATRLCLLMTPRKNAAAVAGHHRLQNVHSSRYHDEMVYSKETANMASSQESAVASTTANSAGRTPAHVHPTQVIMWQSSKSIFVVSLFPSPFLFSLGFNQAY